MFFHPTVQKLFVLCILIKMVVVTNFHVFKSAILLVRTLLSQVCDINSVFVYHSFCFNDHSKIPDERTRHYEMRVSMRQPTETFLPVKQMNPVHYDVTNTNFGGKKRSNKL